jgi:hypothetical protein
MMLSIVLAVETSSPALAVLVMVVAVMMSARARLSERPRPLRAGRAHGSEERCRECSKQLQERTGDERIQMRSKMGYGRKICKGELKVCARQRDVRRGYGTTTAVAPTSKFRCTFQTFSSGRQERFGV